MTRRAAGSPLLAVAYLRASTDDQKLGPEAQRAQIEVWAKQAGVTIASWHVDQGVSGGKNLGDRPALVAALGELRVHGAGVLVVAKRDRLARDVGIALAIERAVAASGAKVVSADGSGNGSTSADAFMRVILDAASQYERDLIRSRTKAALQAKRARGEKAGKVPWGYRDAGGGKLVLDEGEQAIAARARQLRSAGVSLRQVTSALAAEGCRSRVGTPLQLTSVARMVAAPVV